jgi:hypothetical protein
VEIGCGGAAAADQYDGTLASFGQAQGKKSQASLVEMDVFAQSGVLSGSQDQWG